MYIEFNDKYFKYDSLNCVAIDEILKIVESYIDKDRFEHVKSVANLSYQIAIKNNVENPLKYYFAGLVHDIAKNMDKNVDVINKYLTEEERSFPKYCLHQFLAPHIVEEVFSINDEEILDAIKYHCSGKANMSTMAKVVYAADKIDPLRGYDSKYMIDAMCENINTGFILVLEENRKFIKNKGKNSDLNNLSEECFKYYLSE